MPRARKGAARRRAKNRLMKQAKGYVGGRGRLYRTAKEAVLRAAVYATRDRQQRKRVFRRLWITRINAAAKRCGTSYSRLISAMDQAGIVLNRKILAEMAVNDPAAFEQVVRAARAAEPAAETPEA